MGVSADDLERLKRIAPQLSSEERDAVFGRRPAVEARPAHKWSHLADAVPDDKVAEVVNICRAGIRHAIEHRNDDGRDADGEAMEMLTRSYPALATAAKASSNLRGKTLAFSLGSIATYLQSEESERKRAAARRRVPPATTAAVESAGKGGGK
jgi:hypothetical protein